MTQLDLHQTPPTTILEVWSRLLRNEPSPRSSIHNKAFVMAVLYMLHIERILKDPETRQQGEALSSDPKRRENLKRYNKWVQCQCRSGGGGCEKKWNFVNVVGLCRPLDSGKPGSERCRVAAYLGGEDFSMRVTRKPWKVLEMLKTEWKDERLT